MVQFDTTAARLRRSSSGVQEFESLRARHYLTFSVRFTRLRTAQTLVTRCDLLLFRAMTVEAIPYTCHREPRRQGSRSIPICQEIVATELGGGSGDTFA